MNAGPPSAGLALFGDNARRRALPYLGPLRTAVGDRLTIATHARGATARAAGVREFVAGRRDRLATRGTRLRPYLAMDVLLPESFNTGAVGARGRRIGFVRGVARRADRVGGRIASGSRWSHASLPTSRRLTGPDDPGALVPFLPKHGPVGSSSPF
jgi:hypothetical protein